jgi:hypothetical protein
MFMAAAVQANAAPPSSVMNSRRFTAPMPPV